MTFCDLTFIFKFNFFQNDKPEILKPEILESSFLFSSGTEDEENQTTTTTSSRSPKCKLNYRRTIQEGIKFGLSIRELYFLIGCMLQDIGETDLSKYPSQFKIWSQIDKEGKAANEEHSKKIGFKHIAFDGRRDKVAEKNCKFSIQENITVVDAVNGDYIDHLQPVNGKFLE